MGRAILHGAMSGTLENEIGDPFAAKAAAAKRAYTMDPLGDANHQRALQMLNDNMIDEGAGENFQNYAQGMVGHAMDTTTNFALGKMNTNAELAKAMADITLRGNTQQQTQGWLGAALGAVQAGAGIVADSDPMGEHEECCNKARALLAAVPAARRMSRKATS